jgi:hypothetical protein
MNEQSVKEEMQLFTFRGCVLEYRTETEVDWKVTQFNFTYRTIGRALEGETSKTSQMKL